MAHMTNMAMHGKGGFADTVQRAGVESECKHERYNSRADCEQCFGRPPVTIARTQDEAKQDRYFLENTVTGDWDYGPYSTKDQAVEALLAHNAGEEVPES